jgi:hypothetical protein
MFEFQKSEPQAPHCPMCAAEMALKKVHRQPTEDHFIFRCEKCELEYPVVGNKRDLRSPAADNKRGQAGPE